MAASLPIGNSGLGLNGDGLLMESSRLGVNSSSLPMESGGLALNGSELANRDGGLGLNGGGLPMESSGVGLTGSGLANGEQRLGCECQRLGVEGQRLANRAHRFESGSPIPSSDEKAVTKTAAPAAASSVGRGHHGVLRGRNRSAAVSPAVGGLIIWHPFQVHLQQLHMHSSHRQDQ